MYIVIEHSGNEDQVKIADAVRNMAEDDFGFTCEEASSEEGPAVTVYNSDLEKIAEFVSVPDNEVLHFYLSMLEEQDGTDHTIR